MHSCISKSSNDGIKKEQHKDNGCDTQKKENHCNLAAARLIYAY